MRCCTSWATTPARSTCSTSTATSALRVARDTVAAPENEPFELTPDNARQAIDALRTQFGGSELFGREKDQSLESFVRTIHQSFGGQDMYPSVEEKAANLLYFVVKNIRFRTAINVLRPFHSCTFLTAINCLCHPNGTRRLADNALVALTLLIAESKPEHKDTMATLTADSNGLNRFNGYAWLRKLARSIKGDKLACAQAYCATRPHKWPA